MFPVPKHVQPFGGNLKYVDTCPNSPEYGMAFCEEHCETATRNGIPKMLKKFIAYQQNEKGI